VFTRPAPYAQEDRDELPVDAGVVQISSHPGVPRRVPA
jgi:hypothetical protein